MVHDCLVMQLVWGGPAKKVSTTRLALYTRIPHVKHTNEQQFSRVRPSRKHHRRSRWSARQQKCERRSERVHRTEETAGPLTPAEVEDKHPPPVTRSHKQRSGTLTAQNHSRGAPRCSKGRCGLHAAHRVPHRRHQQKRRCCWDRRGRSSWFGGGRG